MVDRGPAVVPYPIRNATFEERSKVVLTRQNAHTVIMFRLHHFIDNKLIVGNSAKTGFTSMNDLSTHIAAARNVPPCHTAIQKTRGIPLTKNVAGAHVLGHCRHVKAGENLLERWQWLETKHVIGIHHE